MFPLRSKVTTVGRQASGARALWRATGTKENESATNCRYRQLLHPVRAGPRAP